MPELPPVTEEFTADTGPYVAALEAMAAAARAAADAQHRLLDEILATQRAMDSMAAQAADVARAEAETAAATGEAADAAAREAAAAAEAAGAERDQASAAGTAAAAEEAAAAAADRLAAANRDVGSSAFSADAHQRLLNATLRAEIAAAAAAAAADRALSNAQKELGDAAEYAAISEEHLAAAEAAGSLAGYQDAQAQETFAEAERTAADSANALSGAIHDVTQAQLVNVAAAKALAGGLVLPLAQADQEAAKAGNSFRLLGTGLRITGATLHWLVAGSLEFLAVAVPAGVAFAAGMAVAAQGAQNVYEHMTAVYTATEATSKVLHTTAGQAVGLGNALQQAQDAANPGVYTILGSVINDVKARFGDLASVGLQVVHMLDEFSARITTDLQGSAGARMQSMLSGMVSDLQRLGQVFGNVGHAILNFASDMPGLATVLLSVADAISRVILWISSLPQWIITAVMALEEFYRWGGVVLNLIIKLAAAPMAFVTWLQGANFITNFGSALLKIINWGGVVVQVIGNMVGKLGSIISVAATAGSAITRLGVSMTTLTASPLAMAGWALAVAAVAAGIGYLTYQLINGKDATEQWIAASDKAVASANAMNVLPTISSQLAQSMARLTGATQQFLSAQTQANTAVSQAPREYHPAASAMDNAAGDALQLAQHMQNLAGVSQTVTTNAHNLAGVLGISTTEAMYAASQAGVHLQASMAKGSEAFLVAENQIRNYITGIGAMGAPMGALGADVEALGIQSQLASSKVQQLNSAWDAWISSVTSGVQSMSQLQTALGAMRSSAASTSSQLSGAIGSIDKATKGTSYTLKGFGQQAMQSWQQFTSAVQTGNTSLDSLRTGMAEGVVSWAQYRRTVQGMVGEMAPFTQGNRAAVSMLSQLAHEAGGPVTTSLRQIEKWAGVSGRTARDQFAKGMLDASIAMGHMSKVAQNLSAVVSGQLTSAMAGAIVKASGLDAAVKKYASDLASGHTASSTLTTDLHGIETAMSRANRMTGQAAQGLNTAANKANQAAASAGRASTQAHDMGSAYSGATIRLHDVGPAGDAAAAGLHKVADAAQQSADQTKTALQPMLPWLQQYGQQVGLRAYQGFQSANLGSKLGTSGHQAVLNLGQAIQGGTGQVVSAVQGIATQSAARANTMAGPFRSAGANASAGAAGGIMAGEGAVVAAATAVANAASAAFASHLHVHSPSTLTHQYGEWFAQGLADGMLAKEAQVVQAAARLAEAAKTAMGITGLTPALTRMSGGGYPVTPSPAPVAYGGGGTTVVVPVQVMGHVVTEQQLMDFIRDGTQTYLQRNPSTGYVRRGRPS